MTSENLWSGFSNTDMGSPTGVSDPISFVETIDTNFDDEEWGGIKGLGVNSDGSIIYVSSAATDNPTWKYDVSGGSYSTILNLAWMSDLAMSSDDKLYYKGYSSDHFYAQATNDVQDWSYTNMPVAGYPAGGRLDVLGSSTSGKFYFGWDDGDYNYSVIRLTLDGTDPTSHDEVLSINVKDVAADLDENLYVITSPGNVLEKYNYASGSDDYTVDSTTVDLSGSSPTYLVTDRNATEEHLYVLGSDYFGAGDKASIKVYNCSDLTLLDEIIITEHCSGIDTYESGGTIYILTATLTDDTDYIWDVHKFRRD